MALCELLADFNKNGYVVVRNFLSAEQKAAVVDAVSGIEQTTLTGSSGSPPTGSNNVNYLHFYEQDVNLNQRVARSEYLINFSPVLNELLTGLSHTGQFPIRELSDNTADAISERRGTLGVDVTEKDIVTVRDLISACNGGFLMNLYKEKINYKYPHTGKFRPHQDITAYPNSRRHITCLISLCDTTVLNGCLHFPAPHVMDNRFQVFPHEKGAMTDTADWEWVPVPTQFGDVVLFDSYVPHLSPKNVSDRPRTSLYATFNDASEGDIREEYYRLKADQTKNGVFSLIDHYDAKFSSEEEVKRSRGQSRTGKQKPMDAQHWSELFAMYEGDIGSTLYDPFCTQREHAFQTAQMARKQGADERMQLACFLHDLGHLLLDEHAGMDSQNGQGTFLEKDLKHETIGFQHLQGLGLGQEVLVPICLHVRAKRYLCSVDDSYWAALSENSKRSLELQGGRLTPEEVEHFERTPFAMDAAQLRRWEDEGKTHYNHTVGGKDARRRDCEKSGEEYLTMQHVKDWVQHYYQ